MKVFICHSEEDSEIVLKISANLLAAGHEILPRALGIELGEHFTQKFQERGTCE